VTSRLCGALAASLLACAVPPVSAAAQSGPAPAGFGPFTSSDARFRVEVVTTGLEVPWGLAFPSDTMALIGERPSGRMSLIDLRSGARTPVDGTPPVFGRDDGGLHDIILHPDFARNRLVYFCYATAVGSRSTTAVDRARLDGARLVGLERLFAATPPADTSFHYGCRLVLDRGYLYVTLGERDERWQAQDLQTDHGKVLRLTEDGGIPPDNPFVGRPGVLPEIWSYGHRNPQGLALRPGTGELWEHEHGPKGGDEVNLIRPGLNYGWPIITYGREYTGEPVGDDITFRAGLEQPVYHWAPSIAPSGMEFYTGQAFPGWRGNLFLGAMAGGHLNRLVLDGDNVAREERLLGGRHWRVRVVRQGPDGFLYIAVDQGMLLRIRPVD
jgi:aldose sugar dehydrogenase